MRSRSGGRAFELPRSGAGLARQISAPGGQLQFINLAMADLKGPECELHGLSKDASVRHAVIRVEETKSTEWRHGVQ
jgi:hypothetical protein